MAKQAEARPPLVLKRTDRVAIVAGSGLLPLNIARGLVEAGHRPFLVVVEGEADGDFAADGFDHYVIRLEEIGDLAAVLKRNRATHVVLAGGISRRPALRRLKPSLGLLSIVRSVLKGAVGGDNRVLSLLVAHLERQGMKVVGAHELVPDLLAALGPLTRHRPTQAEEADLAAAFAAAKAIGALDIGQAAVAIGRRVVALEGIEGTDGLLDRVAGLRGHGRLAGRTGGVLVKCAKPGQELRADLPTIGPQTVEAAHRAGLSGIGVEAERSLILDQRLVIERADALGLFVIGLREAGP
jgi:UDP-2,3-diacylglucosamine hydrolase